MQALEVEGGRRQLATVDGQSLGNPPDAVNSDGNVLHSTVAGWKPKSHPRYVHPII
jgi:hypothetical protein